jgi:hypothetical protein
MGGHQAFDRRGRSDWELYERRGKSWKLIGLIMPEHKDTGFITLVND